MGWAKVQNENNNNSSKTRGCWAVLPLRPCAPLGNPLELTRSHLSSFDVPFIQLRSWEAEAVSPSAVSQYPAWHQPIAGTGYAFTEWINSLRVSVQRLARATADSAMEPCTMLSTWESRCYVTWGLLVQQTSHGYMEPICHHASLLLSMWLCRAACHPIQGAPGMCEREKNSDFYFFVKNKHKAREKNQSKS